MADAASLKTIGATDRSARPSFRFCMGRLLWHGNIAQNDSVAKAPARIATRTHFALRQDPLSSRVSIRWLQALPSLTKYADGVSTIDEVRPDPTISQGHEAVGRVRIGYRKARRKRSPLIRPRATYSRSGGLRKLRFALAGGGKRGGARAIYFLMVADDLAVMVFAHAKSDKEDMTAAEKKAALAPMKEIANERR